MRRRLQARVKPFPYVACLGVCALSAASQSVLVSAPVLQHSARGSFRGALPTPYRSKGGT
eukprot:CAMPEP_0179158784 /NCGR_PEP_ID=MMETSP0796-20121207/77488_1 /TAXON_ID=73915 /ORGANISM="Pyrodinium bahamense, Strain pbaha01" /LENGTH=59 /DNA_ID=CAMNT_0020860465 /DNA_START=204 /DNA_END=379 /DNA_ORIENTATION=+